MVMNLVREFDRRGLRVDLLTIRATGPHLQDLPEGVRHRPLNAKHTLTAIAEIRRYIRSSRVPALLVAKDRAGRAAAIARAFSGCSPRLVVRLGTNLSAALRARSPLSRWLRTAPMRAIYRHIDQVVAVSEGVRQDTLGITGLPSERVSVIRNPVITPQFEQLQPSRPNHDWLAKEAGTREIPVLMAAGRLSHQKGFDLLLKAFALACERRPLRLLILGDGGLRQRLQQQCESLGLSQKVEFVGFQSDIYSWLARADLFVLSSRWEGSPNVLTEALALGVPVVATRCPSGPEEVLQQGKYGPLVPVEDASAMAEAILQRLEQPTDREFLKSAVQQYRAQTSADAYLEQLGVGA